MTGVTMRMCRRLLIIPPITGVASGFITSAPVRVLHMIGQQARDDRGDGHDLRTQAQPRAFFDGCDEIGVPKAAPRSRRFALDRFLQVHDHDDAGLNRGAKERDVADPDGDAEVVAEEVLQKDAAAEREGHGEDDVRGFLRVAIDDVEQQENDRRGPTGTMTRSVLCRADLILVFAAVFDRHSLAAASG